MSVAIAQPIAGVSASRETEVEVIYPSVAANGLGQLVGSVMGLANSVPTTPLRLIACLILGSVMAPLGLLAYAWSKIAGQCYVLTNRSIYSKPVIGEKMGKQVALSDIARIEIESRSGYQFHRVGDLNLESAQGNVLMTISAIGFPERLKQIILDVQAARELSDQSLNQIKARKA